MRHLFLTLMLFTWSSLAISQHTDIIKLHSSEIVRGTITDEIPGVSISILALPDSVLRVIPYSDIEQVIYKEGTLAINKSKSVRQSPDKSGGGNSSFAGFLRMGYGARVNEDEINGSQSFMKADIILATSFSNKFSLGVGFGVRLGNNENVLLPVFVDMRLTPVKGNVSPMVAFSGGVNFQTDQNFRAQKFINPEVGIRLGNPERTYVILSTGLEFIDFFTENKEPRRTYNSVKYYVNDVKYIGYTFSIILGF